MSVGFIKHPVTGKKAAVVDPEYLKSLQDSARWLQALEDAGVDNWDGFEYAQELYGQGESDG